MSRPKSAVPALLISLTFLLAFLAAVAASVITTRSKNEHAGHTSHSEVTIPDPANAPKIGGAFELTDGNGKIWRDTDFQGRWLLVFFGFTYCPDICPTGLQTLATGLEDLGAAAVNFQPVFITIDPTRDHGQVLSDYVQQFDDRLIGLTGTEAQIEAVAKKYRVAYSKNPHNGDDDYQMTHSSVIYLMRPDGSFADMFSSSTSPQELARDLSAYIKAP